MMVAAPSPAVDHTGPALVRVIRDLFDVATRDKGWLQQLDPDVKLPPGEAAPVVLRVPVDKACRVLRVTAHAVSGVPATVSEVVWSATFGELLVHLDDVGLACVPGVITVFVPVACDQIPDGAAVEVAFGVGTEDKPSALIMSTFARPGGPSMIVDGWAPALTAFAWEALLRLAVWLCASAGNDAARHPLIPAHIGAAADILLLQPMARHGATPPTMIGGLRP
jgi:hypothetical protein